ncbi:MAG: nucleotide sugar dehydrogenase [bacterium]
MDFAAQLKVAFQQKRAKVGVVGLGYVGLPMAQLAAESGFHVTGVDVNPDRVQQVNRGESYILDVPTTVLKPLVEQGLIKATTDHSSMADVDVVLITVPTPLNKTGDPDMGYVVAALDSLKPHLHQGMLIALESTTYPGTTVDLFQPAVREAGFTEGGDIFIAFSPERVDPGNPTYGTKNTPKVVGGLTSAGTEVAVAYYREVVDRVVPVSSATAAEMVKIYENTFRAINIGLVNELAIICNLLGLDVWEIVEAAGTKPFGFMPFYPGPGLGGHCIPVDPGYLAWRMRTLKYKTRFIELATEVNSKMPEWVVTRVMEMLNDAGKAIRNSNILLLGVSYKNDINDLRESPAIDVYELLQHRGANVRYHDPYCPTMQVDHGMAESVTLNATTLRKQDLVLITTGHRKLVDYALVLQKAALIFDTRNVTRGMKGKARVIYL